MAAVHAATATMGGASKCRTLGATVGADASVVLVCDVIALDAVIRAVRNSGGRVGLVLKTTGQDPLNDRVRLILIATPTTVFVIDMFAFDLSIATNVLTALGEVEIVGHNLQLVLRFLAKVGFVPGIVYDVVLGSQVLHAGRKAVHHTLRDIVDREIGQSLEVDCPGRDWSVDLTPGGIACAANHAAVLLYLAGSLREKLGAAGLTSTADLEMKSLLGIAWANGIGIDFSSWNTRAEEKRKERDEVLGELFTLDPEHKRRNWNSPPQVLAAFAAAGIEIASTNSKVLVEIDHPLATALRRFRAVDKFVATYEPTWAAEHVRDGRIIPCWTPLGTATGRMSCSKPNLQQIPKAIGYRRCFVAAPGHVLVKGDYSQIELRIVAKIAKEERMLAAFSNNQDLHTLTAAAVTRKPANEVTETDRDLAKSINFGLLYGMGDGGLFDYAHKNYGIAMTLNESRAYRTAFFSSYPGLRRWHDTTSCEKSSESRTLGGRRRLYLGGRLTPFNRLNLLVR